MRCLGMASGRARSLDGLASMQTLLAPVQMILEACREADSATDGCVMVKLLAR
jgi:hypothetical protein